MSEAPVAVRDGTFTIVTNGYADGPAQALQRFLVEHGAARVRMISHPLVPEGGGEHRVATTDASGTVTRRVDLRLRPPLSFALDPFVPLWNPRCDAWFGFNCIATARGLAERSARRAGRVVHWNVDFVPQRFGKSPLTTVYERLDRRCCLRADHRVDLSAAALDARRAHYRLAPGEGAPAVVVPMGSWLGDVPRIGPDAFARRRVVFLGHLVPRMGVELVVDAVARLVAAGTEIRADIVGGGPLLDDVRARVRAAGLDGVVDVHGFVPDHRDVERILAGGTVALAPYVRDPASFTRWADPGKLKAYLGAGLPILLTDVPPNAHELVANGGAELVTDDAADIAAALARLLDDADEYHARQARAAEHGRSFDWDVVLSTGLSAMGFVP